MPRPLLDEGALVRRLKPETRDDIGHARERARDRVDLAHDRLRPRQGGSVRQLDIDEHDALIFARKKRGRQPDETQRRGGARDEDDQPRHHGPARDQSGNADITMPDPVETAVEQGEGTARAMLGRPQDDGAERGREGQRIHRRDGDRRRDGDGELPVELTGDSGKKGDGPEYRKQHESRRDDGTRDLLHGPQRGLAGGSPLLFHDALHVLDDHDRIVDHEADGEHDGEQADRVGRIAGDLEDREDADQRHRNRHRGDDRGAQVLEEDEDDQQHDDGRQPQCLGDLLDGGGHEQGRIVDDFRLEVRGKAALQLRQLRAHLPGDAQRIGVGKLVDRQCRCRHPVELARFDCRIVRRARPVRYRGCARRRRCRRIAARCSRTRTVREACPSFRPYIAGPGRRRSARRRSGRARPGCSAPRWPPPHRRA